MTSSLVEEHSVVCAWCAKLLGPAATDATRLSHGICGPCAEAWWVSPPPADIVVDLGNDPPPTITASELMHRAREILGPTSTDAPPWHMQQVSLVTVAVLLADAGSWSEAAKKLVEAADVAGARGDARSAGWSELASRARVMVRPGR
jgi:hypothetical protein